MRAEKCKVLILTGTMGMGGIENQMMHLIRQADAEKFEFHYTTTVEHPYYMDEIEALGGKCIHIPKTEGVHFLRYCRALYRIIKDGRYDIVHSHELFHSGMVLLTARLAGVKSRIVHAHNWSDSDGSSKKQSMKRKMYNRLMKWMIQNNATQFCACSTYAGEFLYGKKVLQQDNYHLLVNSVDTERFINNDTITGEFSGEGWINVLQAGRCDVVKNQLFTAEIMKELKRRNKKIRVIYAGNDGNAYEKRLREKLEDEGLNEYMLLLGVRKDMDALAHEASAFLLPSLYEGMPLVMIEAQAAGLPCVAADTFSHEVDFGLGYVQWLPLNADVSVWADAVERAVSMPRADKEEIEQVVERVGFDSKSFCKKLCDIYIMDYQKRVVRQ